MYFTIHLGEMLKLPRKLQRLVSVSAHKVSCTSLLRRQHYVKISKEYLTNSHILTYFEFVFLQLQLVKISCKLLSFD